MNKKIRRTLKSNFTVLLVMLSAFSLSASAPDIIQMTSDATYNIDGFSLTIYDLEGESSGHGSMHYAALDLDFDVSFEDLLFTKDGLQIGGSIQSSISERSLDITYKLKTLQSFILPVRSKMFLSGFDKTVGSTTVDLDFDAATLVQEEYLFFERNKIAVTSDDICLEGVTMDMYKDGKISDFEFPIRIIAGDADNEKVGSYITFNCKGFKNFALSAAYDFPKNQLVAYNAPDATTKKDTVSAYFQIRAPKLGAFIATGSITAFRVPGIEDMSFSVDSLSIDYSDVTNIDGFKYKDKKSNTEVDEKWKGIVIKELKMTLPKSVSACNNDKPLEIAANNLVYDRGNGISLTISATNILDIKKGSLNGWGVSIDTLLMGIQYNSVEKFGIHGEVYIPITAKDQNIKYAATFGKDSSKQTQANFVLNLGSEYSVPFLNNAKLKLAKSSVCGIRYQDKQYEPYTNFSGEFNISIGGKGSKIPEINFPKLGFQNLKLNDIKNGIKSGIKVGKEKVKQGAASVKKEVTAGLDNMTIGAFSIGGKVVKVDNGKEEGKKEEGKEESRTEEETEKKSEKVGGFPINIKKWSFTSAKDAKTKESYKVLGADFGLNFTSKKGGGLTGETHIEIKAKIDYAKLLGADRSKAFTYKGTDIDKIAIKGQMGNTSFEGLLAFISADKTYGTGLKGGFKLNFGGKTTVEGLGQFGKVNDYRYFFIDMRAMSSKGLINLGKVKVYGLGGGVYYNMEQTLGPPQKEVKEGTKMTINPEPGISLSGSKYLPKKGLLGFNASTLVGLTGRPEVFSADVTFNIEINRNTMGVEKFSLTGEAYFMSDDLAGRAKAPMQAKIAMLADLKRKVFIGSLSYQLEYPRKLPTIVGSGQGAFQIDLDSEDQKKHKEYFVFGTPTKRFDVALKVPGLGKVGEVTGYVMMGDSLALPGPLTGMFAKYNNDPDYKRGLDLLKEKIDNGGGVSMGVDLKLGKKVVAGPVYVGLQFQMGFDLLMLQTKMRCKGQEGLIGFNGWYGNGRAYAGMKGEAGIKLDTWFYEGDVTLLDIETTALLQAQFPNPVFMKGNLDIKANILAGRVKVNKNLKFVVGEQCKEDKDADAAALVAGIEAIGDIQPAEGDEKVQIYHSARVAFNYPSSSSLTDKPVSDDLLEFRPNSRQKFTIFPFVAEATFVEKDSKTAVLFDGEWDKSKTLYTLKNRAYLKPNTEYKVDIKVKWARSENDGPYNTLNIKGKKEEKIETRSITFKTTGQPDKIVAGMINAKRHMPGKNQRNWHTGFAIPELLFDKTGGEAYFAKTKKKTVDGKSIDVSYDYVVRLTDVKTKEVKNIPLTATPGDKEIRYLKKITLQSKAGSMFGYETVREKSRAIEFTGLDKPDVLKPATVYKLQVIGMPKVDNKTVNANNALTTKRDSVSKVTGITVVSVNNKLSAQKVDASRAIQEDVLYEFHFSTSKYKSLREKLAAAKITGPHQGEVVTTQSFPYSAAMKNLSYGGSSGKSIANDYYYFTVDEGFDKWDLRRLQLNLEFPEAEQSHPIAKWIYNEKPGSTGSYKSPKSNRMDYVRSVYADPGLGIHKHYSMGGSGPGDIKFKRMMDNILSTAWDVPGYWFSTHAPKGSVLELTSGEKASGKTSPAKATGNFELVSGDSQSKYRQNFDFAVSLKRNRTLQKQLESMDVLYKLLLKSMKDKKIVPYNKVKSHWFWGAKVVRDYRKPTDSELHSATMKQMEKRGPKHVFFFQTLKEAHDKVNASGLPKTPTSNLTLNYKYKDKWVSAEEVNTRFTSKFPDGTKPVTSKPYAASALNAVEGVTKSGSWYQVNGDFVIVKREKGSVKHSKYVIDVPNGTYSNVPLRNWTANGSESQIWRFSHLGDGKHFITNPATGKRMDLYAGSVKNGNRIYQWSTTGNQENQKWKIWDNQNGTVALTTHYNNNKTIDLQNSYGNGKKVQIWSWEKGAHAQELFIRSTGRTPIRPDEKGCYTIEAKSKKGHYLDAGYGGVVIRLGYGANIAKWKLKNMNSNEFTIMLAKNGREVITASGWNPRIKVMSSLENPGSYGVKDETYQWVMYQDNKDLGVFYFKNAGVGSNSNPYSKMYLTYSNQTYATMSSWSKKNQGFLVTEVSCESGSSEAIKTFSNNKTADNKSVKNHKVRLK